MIYSGYSTPFYQKKVDASLSFPNREQSRSIEKGRDIKKKKGWFYRRATKGNDGRLSLVQGSLIEGETSSNLDGALRLSPPLPIDAVIANLGCRLQWRRTGRKGSRIPKGESRTIFSPVFLQRRPHDPNQPLFPSSSLRSIWFIPPTFGEFILFEDIEQFCTIILRTLENLHSEDGDLKITARMIELISIHSRDKYLLSVTFLTKFQILSSTYIVDESTAETGYTKSWPGPKLYQSATCKNRLRNGGRPLFFVERDTVHIKLRERAHRLETWRLVPRIAGGVRNWQAASL